MGGLGHRPAPTELRRGGVSVIAQGQRNPGPTLSFHRWRRPLLRWLVLLIAFLLVRDTSSAGNHARKDLWPTRTISYRLDSSAKGETVRISQAIATWERATRFRFVEVPSGTEPSSGWIEFRGS